MLKKVMIIILIILALCLIQNKALAIGSLEIVILEKEITIGETLTVSVQVHDMSIAASTIQLFFDSSKVEYIGGPENSNQLENMILYTWADENGGDTPIVEGEIAKFSFKAKTVRAK